MRYNSRMKLLRIIGALVLALGGTGPMSAGAQSSTDPTSLNASANSYFKAVYSANGPAIDNTITKTFHEIDQYGKQLSYDQFIKVVFGTNVLELPPVGTDI